MSSSYREQYLQLKSTDPDSESVVFSAYLRQKRDSRQSERSQLTTPTTKRANLHEIRWKTDVARCELTRSSAADSLVRTTSPINTDYRRYLSNERIMLWIQMAWSLISSHSHEVIWPFKGKVETDKMWGGWKWRDSCGGGHLHSRNNVT